MTDQIAGAKKARVEIQEERESKNGNARQEMANRNAAVESATPENTQQQGMSTKNTLS